MPSHGITSVGALLLCAPLALGAQATGVVSGRVTDAATGQPVADARLTIEGTNVMTTSRGNGEYVLAGVPAGPRVVVARRVGYGMARRELEGAAGQTVTADFALRAAAGALDEVGVT